MNITLLSCNAQRPDRRAITNCISEFSIDVEDSLANELTEILLDGDAIDIQVDHKNSSSAFRAFRKLEIDYEILE